MFVEDINEVQVPRGIDLSEKEEKALLKKTRQIFLRREKEEAEMRRKEMEQFYGIGVHS